MRRLPVAFAILVACGRPSPSPVSLAPPPGSAGAPAGPSVDASPTPVDAGSPPVDAAPAWPARPYRTAASDYDVEPTVAGSGATFLVESEDALATRVGRDVLAAGGNAVDAAVATAFALAVTRPTAGNLGGGGFAVVRTGRGAFTALDFRETAPAAATSDMFDEPRASLIGARASGVPGSVAGLWALHARLGSRRWRELVAPAIALATDGYPVTTYLHAAIERRLKLAPMTGALGERFAPGGTPLPVGAIVKNPELARVLARVAERGTAGFYQGPTAQAIADAMKAQGGLITRKDLAGYKAVWRTPVVFGYRGRKLATMPLPSSGGIVLAMTANMLRGVELGALGWHSAEHVRWLTEVWRRAYAVRNTALGDPAFVKKMPIDRLLSQAEADRLVATIGDRATPSTSVPGLIEGTHTTHLSVVDARGMAVALTTTLNTSFGSGVVIEGILMNNEMDDFATRPGQPNAYGLVQGAANKIEPGKRMLSSMSPTIVEDERGELLMVVGAQGGARITTSVWQVISNVLDFGFAADAAVAAPRVHHQHLPDDVVVEDESIDEPTDAALRARGYEVVWGARDRILASVGVIVRTAAGWAGAADPRGGGAAMGD